MSKRVLTIVVAATAAALLGIAVLILSLNPKDNSKDNSSSNNDASSSITSSEQYTDEGYISVYSYEKDQMRKVVVKNKVGGFTVRYVKKDTYTVDGMGSISVDDEVIQDLLTRTEEFAATKVVAENPKDLEPYGLDEPTTEVEISYNTGETLKISFGDTAPRGGKYSYIKNNDKVYIVNENWEAIFEGKFTQFLDMTIVNPLETDEEGNQISVRVKKLHYYGTALKTPITIVENPEYITEQQKEESEGVSDTTETKLTPAQFLFESPFKAEAFDEYFAGRQYDYFGVVAYDIYKINPTSKDFKDCGLDNPYVNIEIVVPKETIKIKLGKKLEIDGVEYYYASSSHRNAIFIAEAEDFTFFEEDMINYINPIVINEMIDEFKTMTAEYNGKKYTFEMTGENDGLVVRWNGKKMSTKEFRDLYQLVMLALCEESVEQGQYTGKADLALTYTYRNKDRVDKIEYVKVAARKYMIRKNGNDLALVRSKYVDSLISGIDKFVAGKDVPSGY